MRNQKSKKRRIFALLNMKEQIALTICIVLLLIAVAMCARRKWKTISELKAKNEEKSLMHGAWKAKKSDLEDEFHNVIQHVMKQEKVDEKHLMEIVEEAARETKVRYEADPPVTEENGIFKNHKVTVKLQDAPMNAVVAFDEKIEQGEANVRVDEMTIYGGRNGNMSTEVTVSALDLATENDLLQEVADILEAPELFKIYGDLSLTEQLGVYE
jgi:hypothetical protein